MNFFRRMFRRPRYRSTKAGESLTQFEKEAWRNMNGCPDCGSSMGMGPEGGCMINVACSNCGSEFNITPGLLFADRLSDRGKPRIERLKRMYGIELPVR